MSFIDATVAYLREECSINLNDMDRIKIESAYEAFTGNFLLVLVVFAKKPHKVTIAIRDVVGQDLIEANRKPKGLHPKLSSDWIDFLVGIASDISEDDYAQILGRISADPNAPTSQAHQVAARATPVVVAREERVAAPVVTSDADIAFEAQVQEILARSLLDQ